MPGRIADAMSIAVGLDAVRPCTMREVPNYPCMGASSRTITRRSPHSLYGGAILTEEAGVAGRVPVSPPELGPLISIQRTEFGGPLVV